MPSPSTGAGPYLPRLIFWEVTKGCNLHCMHCRATATELASPQDLPTAQCLNIIDQIAALSNPTLVLSGGEPLYRSDIFQLAQYATHKGLPVELATNGTLVTKEVAQKILEAGIKRVSISLDGANADTHDSFRGIPGSFDAAIYGFRNLKALGIPVQINVTIARHNADELPKLLEMVRNLGADALHTFLHVPVGCGVEIAKAQMVAPEESERILNWLHEKAAEGGIETNATCTSRYCHVERPCPEASPTVGSTEMNMGCPAETGVCFVSFEGEVFPCCHLPAIAGDLRKQPFAEIWNNSAVFADL